jgi:mono/diheme cytochrome c family protein
MRVAAAMFTLMLSLALSVSAPAQDKKPVSFEKDVQPIIKASCLSCHKPDKKKGKLDMSTYEALMKGGDQGAPVKPGDAKKSLLIEVVSGKEPEMPEKGDPLTPAQIDILSRWIMEGAKKN